MSVRFIFGRAGAGKTRACLDALADDLAQAANTHRLMLLVPEQASFQMEHALARRAPRGAYSRAAVLSFSRLARVVFNETGGPPATLGGHARALALRHVVARQAERLRMLRSATRTAGFYVELERLIGGLVREDVGPEALAFAAGRLDGQAAQKVREVAELYAAYVAWLGPERSDPAGQLAVLRARLEQLGWLRAARIWVDGFAGFTGQELATLVSLGRCAHTLTITLLLDPDAPAVADPRRTVDDLDLFARTQRTWQRLMGLFDEARVAVEPPVVLRPARLPRFARAPALARLEAGLATPVTVPLEPGPEEREPPADVALHEFATVREELRAAARWVRTTLADAGGELHFRDFAVIARDLEPFVDTIAEVFGEFEIPYFMDRRRPLRAHPLIRLVPALFEVVTSDFDVMSVVRLLRTRLLPVPREAAEQLENVIVRHEVRGLALWQQPAWELETAGRSVPACADERARLVAGIEPLRMAATEAGGATGATWARALHGVLAELGVRQTLEGWINAARRARRWEQAETHRLAWEALCAALDDLHDVLGETRLSAADAAAAIGGVLSEQTIGLAPPTLDQVLVSSIERSRHPDIRYAWVFAFNEGVFPAPVGEDRLINTAERTALAEAGLAAPTRARDEALGERMLAYIALTRPSQGLRISFALSSDAGDALQPSPFVADVRRALPNLPTTRLPMHEPPVCLPELVRGYLATGGEARHGLAQRRYAELLADVSRDARPAERLAWLLRGTTYANEAGPLRRARATPDTKGVVWDASVSEIETYLQCPYRHFARFGLRLDPTRGPHPLRWDLGDIAHRVLADVVRRAGDGGRSVRKLTDERWQELLAAAIADYRKSLPTDTATRRPDLAFLIEVLAARLKDVVTVHAARWRRGAFELLCCEQAFGGTAAGAWPAVAVTLPGGGVVQLHGRVDRVDGAEVGGERLLLVYDYKSNAEPLTGSYLIGQRLQFFLYLLAVQQALPEGRAAGVLSAPLYPDLGALNTGYVAAAPPDEQLLYMYRPRGLFSGAAADALDASGGAGWSPVASIRRKKDGDFYKTCDAKAVEEIDGRVELAAEALLLAGAGVAAGCIEVAPLVERRTLACRTCDYAAVCRFDRAYNRPRAAEAVLPSLPGGDELEGGEA